MGLVKYARPSSIKYSQQILSVFDRQSLSLSHAIRRALVRLDKHGLHIIVLTILNSMKHFHCTVYEHQAEP